MVKPVPNIVHHFSQVRNQILATVAANISCVAQGCSIGWLSPALLHLLSDHSPLASGTLTTVEVSWIASLIAVGSITGSTLYGTMSNYVGSKRALLACALPLLCSWMIIWSASSPWHLFLARFLSGTAGGGLLVCLPLYVAEISDDYIRGQLSSLMQLSYNAGIMLGYIVGSTFSYTTVPLVLNTLPIVFLAIFIWIPSSPQYLLKINDLKAAEKSLRFYRNTYGDRPADEQRVNEELQKFVAIAKQNAELPALKMADFLTRDALRGILIGIALLMCAQFSGSFTLANYAGKIFQETGSTFDPNLSTVIIGGTQLIGTIIATMLIDRMGRKALLLISLAGATVALVITGGYSFLSANGHDVSAVNLLPVISLSAFIFISSVGIMSVPYVIIAEVLPQRIRRIGSTICFCTMAICVFTTLRFFPMLLELIQLYGCMWFFAGVSSVGCTFVYFVVPETKGDNLDRIDESAPVKTSDKECDA